MNAWYHTSIESNDFEINLAEINHCKGVFKIEVQVHALSVPLLVKDGSEQRITLKEPFVLVSTHPMVSGLLRFEFSEYPELENTETTPFKKAIVRYLYRE